MKNILILRHIGIEGPGTFGDFLTERKMGFQILDAFERDGAVLSDVDLEKVSAVVILGGPMNVYEEDKYPFLRSEKYLIREIVLQKIPLIGICLGAQMIAVSLGARVTRAPKKEIGWHDVRLTNEAAEDPLFKDLPQDLEVFQWHEDTFDLPQNATLLSKSNGMYQAFRFHGKAWALQFHIEVDKPMIASWCGEHVREGASSEECRKMLERYDVLEADFRRQARKIYAAFLEQISG